MRERIHKILTSSSSLPLCHNSTLTAPYNKNVFLMCQHEKGIFSNAWPLWRMWKVIVGDSNFPIFFCTLLSGQKLGGRFSNVCIVAYLWIIFTLYFINTSCVVHCKMNKTYIIRRHRKMWTGVSSYAIRYHLAQPLEWAFHIMTLTD